MVEKSRSAGECPVHRLLRRLRGWGPVRAAAAANLAVLRWARGRVERRLEKLGPEAPAEERSRRG